MNTGNSSSTYVNHNGSPGWLNSLDQHTGSQPDQMQPMIMFGKMKRQLLEADSNLEQNLCDEMWLKIGSPSWTQLNVENWTLYRQMCTFDVMATSGELPLIIFDQLLSNERFMCFGERQEQANLEEPGTKPPWTLTQRILGLSSGMGMEAMNMLLSMNSEVASTYHTYSDGSIDILLLWKSKDHQQCLKRKLFGSQATSTQNYGTQNLTQRQNKLYYED